MQPAELWPGLDADLLHERGTRRTVGLQRFRLPPRAIQRDHKLPVQAFAKRVLRDEPLELGDELAMATVRQLVVDRLLQRGQPQLLQATDLRRRERLVCDVGERRATPQRERLARCAIRHEPLESSRVDLVVGDAQLVAAPAREDLERVPVSAVVQRPPQLRDVLLDHLRRARRRLLAPQPREQRVSRHGAVGVDREHRQQGALLTGHQRDRPPADKGLDRAQDAHAHDAQRDRTPLADAGHERAIDRAPTAGLPGSPTLHREPSDQRRVTKEGDDEAIA